MKLIITLLLLPLVLSASVFTQKQIDTANQVKEIAKLFKAKDGETFTNALTAIALRESSLNVKAIGDHDINLPINEASLGLMQIKLTTAKYVISKTKELHPFLTVSDSTLVNMLLKDHRFSVLIAGYYMVMNYNIALDKHMWNPYYRAISRHNGGWNNMKYYKAVIKDMRLLQNQQILK